MTATTLEHEEPVDGTPAKQWPQWFDDWSRGERLVVKEWDQGDLYRLKNGWQGRDLIHDLHSAVRIHDYFVEYGSGDGLENVTRGGIGTKLAGIVEFTPAAESHRGFCHGGSMTSVLDDIIGWIAFCVTGVCKPWSGFTVKVDTNLLRPINVGAVLLVEAEIVGIERRKIAIDCRIVDPAEDHVHARGSGLVVLNRGVLPAPNRESMDSLPGR